MANGLCQDRGNGNINYERFKSYVDFSEFFVRDRRKFGTVRGRYQLRTLKYTVSEDSQYKTILKNKERDMFDNVNDFGPNWNDKEIWVDSKKWVEEDVYYERVSINDDKVLLMGDSKNIEIRFESIDAKEFAGFELSTLNIEGLFTQRSSRIN